MSLARRFLLTNLVVVVLASLGVAAWVGRAVEESVLNRTASVTALYIQSFIEPQIEELASSRSLSAARVEALDQLLTDTEFGEQVASFQVWTRDGLIVYASNHNWVAPSHRTANWWMRRRATSDGLHGHRPGAPISAGAMGEAG